MLILRREEERRGGEESEEETVVLMSVRTAVDCDEVTISARPGEDCSESEEE